MNYPAILANIMNLLQGLDSLSKCDHLCWPCGLDDYVIHSDSKHCEYSTNLLSAWQRKVCAISM